MNREQALRVLAELRGDQAVVVTTMGSVRLWSLLSQSALDFPSAGSAMGHAADFAMGLALAQPQRPVWVLNGDGSMLMSLGTLVTICQTPPPNLVLFVMQNESFEVTGNQPVPGAGKIDMAQMARGAGFANVHDFDNTKDMSSRLPTILRSPGPIFVNLKIEAGQEAAPKLDCPLRVPAAELHAALA